MTGRSTHTLVSALAAVMMLGRALAQEPVQISPPAQSEDQPARPAKRPATKAPATRAPTAKQKTPAPRPAPNSAAPAPAPADDQVWPPPPSATPSGPVAAPPAG